MQDEKAFLEKLAEQEQRLVFSEFSMAMAQHVGIELVQYGRKRKLPYAIDITRNGQCLFHCALEGATPDNARWIERKKKVVNRFGHSSLYMGTHCRIIGQTLEEKYLLPANEFAAHGGAFPIIIKNTGVVGTVTVSGLPQVDDHELVVKMLGDLL